MRSRGEGEIGGEIGAIVRRVARSTIAIDERARRTIALLVNRAARRSTSGAIAGEVSSSSLFLRSGLSLSLIWALFSLSLSLSLSLFLEMI